MSIYPQHQKTQLVEKKKIITCTKFWYVTMINMSLYQ